MNPSDRPYGEWEAELLPDAYDDTVQEEMTAAEHALDEIAGAENIPSDDIYDNGAVGTEDTSSDERYEEENTEEWVSCSRSRS